MSNLKECPNCNKKTIPIKWILFHQLFKKDCNFFECPNCKKNIITGHLFNFDLIYTPFTDFINTPLLILVLYVVFGFIDGLLIIIGFIISYTLLFLLQQYIAPLELAVETKCEEKGLTRIQAFFALILIMLIVSFTVYELLIKPLVLNKPVFT